MFVILVMEAMNFVNRWNARFAQIKKQFVLDLVVENSFAMRVMFHKNVLFAIKTQY